MESHCRACFSFLTLGGACLRWERYNSFRSNGEKGSGIARLTANSSLSGPRGPERSSNKTPSSPCQSPGSQGPFLRPPLAAQTPPTSLLSPIRSRIVPFPPAPSPMKRGAHCCCDCFCKFALIPIRLRLC